MTYSTTVTHFFLNLNKTQTQQTQTQIEIAGILDGDSSINDIMDKACEDIYKKLLIEEVSEMDDNAISQPDPSNSTPAFVSYFNILRIRAFCLCLTVDAKFAPSAKHTASRTSWLHTRRDHKTCQSIFPEN
jgi:hypothetical protein